MPNLLKYILLSGTLFLCTGCSDIIDSLVVPINNATTDLNGSSTMPVETFSDTSFKIRGTKVRIEKNF
jgi:hypothetical protein